MSEKDSGNIRRVTRKDRKRKIETSKLEFPPDDLRYAPPESVEPAAETIPEAPVESAAPPGEPDVEASIEEAVVIETAPETLPAERFPPLEFSSGKPGQPQVNAAPKTVPPRRNPCLYNVIALFFLLATVVAVAWVVLVWNNPYTPLNPLAPFTPLPIIVTTTPLPPTPTVPPTLGPTDTLEPTATFTPLAVLSTRSPFAFVMADTGVVYTPNGNGQECAWASIAGSVTDSNGAPLNDYQVRVEGEDFSPQPVRTGATLTYGAGGFEMPLGDAPRDGDYTIQLLDPDGSPVSDTYTVTTRADCDANVAIVNFVGQ